MVDNDNIYKKIVPSESPERNSEFKEAKKLIGLAQKQIIFFAYTYDLRSIQDALIAAQERLRQPNAVRACLDHRVTANSDKPRDQRQFAQQLEANKIPVILLKGGELGPEYKAVNRKCTGRGIQHAKSLLVDNKLILGSTNWTVSSRANSELGVLLELKEETAATVRDILEARMKRGERLMVVLSRPRSRSADTDRYGGHSSNGNFSS